MTMNNLSIRQPTNMAIVPHGVRPFFSSSRMFQISLDVSMSYGTIFAIAPRLSIHHVQSLRNEHRNEASA